MVAIEIIKHLAKLGLNSHAYLRSDTKTFAGCTSICETDLFDTTIQARLLYPVVWDEEMTIRWGKGGNVPTSSFPNTQSEFLGLYDFKIRIMYRLPRSAANYILRPFPNVLVYSRVSSTLAHGLGENWYPTAGVTTSPFSISGRFLLIFLFTRTGFSSRKIRAFRCRCKFYSP